jgi:transposase
MKESTSIKLASDSVLIGLDWAKNKHDTCLLAEDGTLEYGSIEQDQIKLNHWLDYLCGRFKGRRIAICMEAGRDPLLWRLEGHEQVDLFVVNTTTAARYRKAFAPSGDKNDQRDAASLLDLICRHPEKVTPHSPASAEDRAMDQLTKARRQSVNQLTGVVCSLREVLELYYPVVSKLFEHLGTALVIDFLRKWPDPKQLLKARDATLVKFFHQHNSRSQKCIDKRLELIKQCVPVTADPMLLEVSHLRIEDHLSQIESLNGSIKQYDDALERAFSIHEKRHLFEGLPGAGEALAPRLLAAFSINNPKDANEMQLICGIAPIRVQSGQSMCTFMRRQCPKFLRQSFHEFAGSSIQSSLWAKAFYDDQTKTKNSGSNAAKRALAYKWIRVLTACWISDTPYNELKYIAQLQKRNSPLAELIFQNKACTD